MNELPDEIVLMIFNDVDLNDLFENCRLVSKRWKNLVDSIQFEQLVVTDSQVLDCKNKLFQRFKSINFILLIHHPIYLNLKTIVIKNNFSKVKYLRFDFAESFIFDIKEINKFINLEHLIIHGIFYFQLKKKSFLYLPNLKYLHLNILINHFDKLLVDAIKLEVLTCPDSSLIDLVHPESIKFLKESKFAQCPKAINDLKNLKNLKVFRINIEKIKSRDRNVLSKLPIGLEKLHFEGWFYDIENDLSIRNTIDWNNYFNSILNDKVAKGRTNLKIYLDEIELVENKSFEEYRFDCKERLEFYCEYYEQFTILPQFIFMDYNKLIKAFNNVIPKNFFNKFSNIQSVIVRGSVNTDQLIWFLNGVPNLSCLELRDGFLGQQFYNQLPKITNLLVEFDLHNLGINEDIQMDFRFVTQFRWLSSFSTNQYVPVESIEYIVKNSKFLTYFRYKNIDKSIKIFKSGRNNQDEFRLTIPKNFRLDIEEIDQWFENQNELV